MSSYSELLSRPEWEAKRTEVFSRTGCCDDCGRARWSRRLEVHHLYYELGRMPWDYPLQDLVALCRECHRIRHGLSRAPLRRSVGHLISNPPICTRCDGEGYITQFQHIEDGVCFRCWGSGHDFESAIRGLELEIKKEPNQSTTAQRASRVADR